jgi:hypothetical protein
MTNAGTRRQAVADRYSAVDADLFDVPKYEASRSPRTTSSSLIGPGPNRGSDHICLMLVFFALAFLTGCQNPGRFQASQDATWPRGKCT